MVGVYLKVKSWFEKHYVASITILYGLIGYFIGHPVINAITELFHVHEDGRLHLHWADVMRSAKAAFDYNHWPMAVALTLLSAMLGYYFSRSMREYRVISEQTKRFSQIGMNAATITHDLNNTITIINSFAEIIKEELKDQEQIRYCEIIQDNARNISRMVKDIKVVALDPHTIYLVKENVDLKIFSEQIVKNIKLRAKIEVTSSDDDTTAKIDPGYFERVLWNLIKNADEALLNVAEPLIKIHITKKNSNILINIIDNGPGIPEQIKQDLFKLGSTYGKHGGTGIGLYSSKMIIEAHKGKIWFESKIGRGATFYIMLPE